MKKLIFLSLAFFLSSAALALAVNYSVQVPSSFSLNVGDSATVTNYHNTKIDLTGIGSVQMQTYPPQTRNMANIHVSIPDSSPTFNADYTLSAGGSVTVRNLTIKAITVSSNSVGLQISLSSGNTTQPPATEPGIPPRACTMEAKQCPDGSYVGRTGPNCEFSPCPGTGSTSPGTGGGSDSGGSTGGFVGGDAGLIICSNGDEDNDCSTCSENGCTSPASPGENPPAVEDGSPPILYMPQGYEILDVAVVEAEEDASVQYEVKAQKTFRLFYFLPINAVVTYSIDAETGVATITERPWWHFLAL